MSAKLPDVTLSSLSPISGPFSDNEDYIIVADFDQQQVYQLQPDTGEVRGMVMRPCQPMAAAFDESINGMYLLCDEEWHSRQSKFVILRKSFDNRISETIYSGTTGVSGIVSGNIGKNLAGIYHPGKNHVGCRLVTRGDFFHTCRGCFSANEVIFSRVIFPTNRGCFFSPNRVVFSGMIFPG